MVKDCTILFRKWLTEISVEENCLKQELLLQLPDIYLGGRKLDHYVIKLSEIGHGCSPVTEQLSRLRFVLNLILSSPSYSRDKEEKYF